MPTYTSLLRGINVSGQKTIRKDDLLGVYTSLGFAQARTYLQSGNVVFTHDETSPEALAAQIEARIAQVFGHSVAVLVRDSAYFSTIRNGNPFLLRGDEPSALYVTFLYQPADPEQIARLQIPAGETGVFALGDRAVYLFVPDGYGRTKLSNTFFERKLGVTATTRNWNTVQALVSMSQNPG